MGMDMDNAVRMGDAFPSAHPVAHRVHPPTTSAMKLRHHMPRLTLGLRMALLPAIAAGGLTLALAGMGRHGVGVGLAVAIALATLAVIAVPIDRYGGRARHAARTHPHHRSAGRRRK